jgi:nucleotide-binding universal stress UspA family protein
MTLPFERILLATEHTEFDVGAERVAMEIARECDVPLGGVLPIVSNVEYEAVAPELAARAEEDAFAMLTQLRRQAQTASVDLDIRVRRGEEPYREIIAEARARHADLIVVRRRGKRGFLAELMVGEMVGKVATLAPCSVLLVPRAGRMWSQRVLAAVDTSPAAETVTAVAAGVAVRCKLPLLIASVATDDAGSRSAAETAVAKAIDVAMRLGATTEGRALVGRPAERIAALATDTGADLLVVGRRGESAILQRMLLGGTAHKIAGLAQCPVLVVKA